MDNNQETCKESLNIKYFLSQKNVKYIFLFLLKETAELSFWHLVCISNQPYTP